MVYFIKAERLGLIKIGCTRQNLQDRLDDIQSVSPDKLVVLKTTMGGSDRRFHIQFEKDWSHNEWFRPSAELLQFIDALEPSKFDGMTGHLATLNRATFRGKRHSKETRLKMQEAWARRKALKNKAHI